MAIPDCICEVCFETCNKVGGIYTVVSTKAEYLKKYINHHYIIGPYFHSSMQEFIVKDVPSYLKDTIVALAQKGIIVHYGIWNIAGQPQTFLIEFQSVFPRLDNAKKLLWEQFGVDSLQAGYDYDEPLAFSLASAELIAQIATIHKNVVAQSHEWITGFTNLFLKSWKVNVGTVFTTHATVLGRSLCYNKIDLYKLLETQFSPTDLAIKYGVNAKHSAEKAAANYSNIFTTVSEVTAIECTKILGKKPDILTLNGFNIAQIPSFENLIVSRKELRTRLFDFLQYTFWPYYEFDLNKTTILFTSGRHELTNKGFDVMLKSMGLLNKQLQEQKSDKTVCLFFFVPYSQHGVRRDVLEQKLQWRHMKRLIHAQKERMESQLLANNNTNTTQIQMDPHLTTQLHKKRQEFKKNGNAPLSPFIIDEQNEVIKLCLHYGLYNSEIDRVKIIYYPIYLTGNDQLLDFEYYDAVLASDTGLFISYYEPWGYTPQEGVALSIPVITTDLAGFGNYIQQHLTQTNSGLHVINRRNSTDEDVAIQTCSIIHYLLSSSEKEKIKTRINALQLSERTDWNTLIRNYIDAYTRANT